MSKHGIVTKNWEAVEKSDLIGHENTLGVSGEVEVPAGNDFPHLKEVGTTGSTLTLDLSITQKGIGDQHVQFKTVEHVKKITGHAFEHVDILFHGKLIEKIRVSRLVSAVKEAAR